jgi:PAS domain S-box-containing protein
MKERLRQTDWSTTPLGLMDQWPQSLKTAVSICMNSRFPMFVWWSSELINIYNDAYIPVLGKRHPAAFGKPAKSIWGEIWQVIGPQAEAVMLRGESTWNDRVLLVMERQGYSEDTWFTWSYSPIHDESGNVGGLFCACTEETARVIAERDLAKLLAELKSERANLGAIIENAPAFIATLRGPDHVFELVNQKYLDLIGGREVVGKPLREALPEVVDQGFIDVLDRVYRTGEPHVGNESAVLLRNQSDGKSQRYVLTFVYQALRDSNGDVSGVFVHGVDVTDLTTSRAELGEREDRFRQVANATPQIIYTGTPDGRIEYYNRRWWEYIGVSEDVGVDSIRWEDYIHPEDLPRVTETWQYSIRTGEPQNVEFRLRSAAGKYRWFVARAEPARDAAGRIYRWFGTSTDIDNRKRIEARDRLLVELDDATRPLVEPEEITATYARLLGQHLNVDRCAYADVEADEDTFNLTGDYNRGVSSIVGRYRFAEFGQEVLALMRSNQPFVVNDIDTHQPPISDKTAYNATEIQAVVCVPLHKRGRFVAAMAVHMKTPRQWTTDEVELLQHIAARCWESIERARVTRDREQLLQSEQAARSEAERAGRMKDEFLATLSHELRTPLNAILGWSQVVRRGTAANPPNIMQAMEVIERNARSQAQIIEDLLDMSRIISGKVRLDVQRLDLASVVHAAIDTARPTAETKGVRLTSVIDPLHGVVVSGDVNRLQQVLWNLLSNAIKFTPRGGRVQVLLERVNSHLEISVVDTGEGIKPEFLPYVFDRFRQADASTTRRHGGLGLGLSIVKQLVELHGGSIRVKSAGIGQGATFIVALPLTALHPEPADDTQRRHPRATPHLGRLEDNCVALKDVRVLVVDDERDARMLVRRFLEECEATVATAGSAEEAIARLQQGPFDVLVSDIGMPGTDGYEMIRRIRALGRTNNGDVPAIALTAYARTEDRVRAIAAGFQMHIAKPVEPVELITLVASAAGRTGRSSKH